MWQWLQKEARITEVPFIAVIVVAAYLGWCALLFVAGAFPEALLSGGNTVVVIDTGLIVYLAMSALSEEMMFRAPLTIAVRVLRRPWAVAVCAAALSCVFGYMHEGRLWSIPIQGMFGLLTSVMYLKCGGANGKFVKPVLCTTFAHLMNNVCIFYIADLMVGGQ